MFLNSLATANPAHSFTQQDIWQELQKHPEFNQLHSRSRSLLDKILTNANSGINHLQFNQADLQSLFSLDAQSLNRSFELSAPCIANNALQKALEQADTRSSEIDALFVCTCTGYLCPGPSSYIAEMTGLRSDTYLVDLVGLGCGAAIPTLRAAQGYLAANPTHRVAVIAVEISSAAFYLDDDPGVLISLCLFGDGAAAAILSGQSKTADELSFHRFDTIHVPENREKIRFINAGGKLKNQLHRTVPELAADAVAKLFGRKSHAPNQILAHSGGRDVIEAIEAAIPPYYLTETREILKRHGNMSSPSVLFALEQRLRNHPDETSLWITAFGAGFSAHSCQLSRA